MFLQRHAEGRDGLAGEFEGYLLAIEALEAFAVDLAEKIVFAGGDVVDQVLRKGFLLGEGLGFAHRAFGDFDVAAAPGNHGAHERGGIVFDFLLHHVVGLDLSWPKSSTGCAAPALVPGAMAATSAASRMKIPAEPARLPLGVT